MGYDEANWGVSGWLAMSLMMLLFLALVIGVIVWVVRTSGAGGADVRPHDGSGATDRILAERLARGEIDETEFERLRSLLDAAGR